MTTNNAEGDWPKSMRAWIYDSASAGLEKSLRLHDAAAPPPPTSLSPKAVLVQVLYMSVNPADYKVAELGLLSRPIVAPPASPGMDFSGRVVRAGADAAAAYEPGRLVFGRVFATKFGALGGLVVVKDGEGLAPAPEGLGEDGMARLAAVGTCGLTALQSIQPYLGGPAGGGKEEEEVFINGGSGGLGTFGIQVAKALGCRVTASCSGANAELCRSLGADEVIDYKTQDVGAVLKAKGKVFRLVVDNVGYTPGGQEDLYTAANAFLQDDGYFVQVGGGASKAMLAAVAKRALVPGFLGGGKRRFRLIATAQSHEGLARIGEWMRTGDVRAVIDEVFTFEDAPKAYEKLKTGRAKGKIVVKVSD